MNVKMIGVVKYREVEKLIKDICRKPKVENRGTFFKKRLYTVYASSDKKYSLAFKYKGEFRWGPKYYSLRLETVKNNNIVIKKDFGNRIFICDHYRSYYPWADLCHKFYLQEMKEMPGGKSSNLIQIYDADEDVETLVAENGVDILVWSKKVIPVVYMNHKKDNTIDVVITDLFNKKVIHVNKGSTLRFFFVDKNEKYAIAIEQNEQSGDISLKIFALSDANLIYSQKIDFKKYIRPLSKLSSFFIKKNKFFDANKPWFIVKFDKDNNILYFGFQKEGSLWGEDYYERLIWLKAKLEI